MTQMPNAAAGSMNGLFGSIGQSAGSSQAPSIPGVPSNQNGQRPLPGFYAGYGWNPGMAQGTGVQPPASQPSQQMGRLPPGSSGVSALAQNAQQQPQQSQPGMGMNQNAITNRNAMQPPMGAQPPASPGMSSYGALAQNATQPGGGAGQSPASPASGIGSWGGPNPQQSQPTGQQPQIGALAANAQSQGGVSDGGAQAAAQQFMQGRQQNNTGMNNAASAASFGQQNPTAMTGQQGQQNLYQQQLAGNQGIGNTTPQLAAGNDAGLRQQGWQDYAKQNQQLQAGGGGGLPWMQGGQMNYGYNPNTGPSTTGVSPMASMSMGNGAMQGGPGLTGLAQNAFKPSNY